MKSSVFVQWGCGEVATDWLLLYGNRSVASTAQPGRALALAGDRAPAVRCSCGRNRSHMRITLTGIAATQPRQLPVGPGTVTVKVHATARVEREVRRDRGAGADADLGGLGRGRVLHESGHLRDALRA